MRSDMREWLSGLIAGVEKHVKAVQDTIRLHDANAAAELDGIWFCLNRAQKSLSAVRQAMEEETK